MKFELWLEDKVKTVENALRNNFVRKEGIEQQIYDAMEYSLFAGGKRLRPMVTLLSGAVLACQSPALANMAAMIECLHTATLLHDDVVDN